MSCVASADQDGRQSGRLAVLRGKNFNVGHYTLDITCNVATFYLFLEDHAKFIR